VGVARCFNCYVISGEQGDVVVAPPSCHASSRTWPAPCPMVRTVTATHGHPDHLSAASAITTRYGAETHVPANTLTCLDPATQTPLRQDGIRLLTRHRSA
jgi:glyoxylase-like metal-dependent hydrolase (beta-lactamase superfamily II)